MLQNGGSNNRKGGNTVVRTKIVLPVLLAAAAFTAGCAVDASTQKTSAAQPAATAQQQDVEVGYITGSRLPRKATQNTQGVTQTSPADWQRYNQPSAPLQSN